MASSQIRYTAMFEDLEKELEDLDNIFESSENLKNYSSPDENGNYNFLVKQFKISAGTILFDHIIAFISPQNFKSGDYCYHISLFRFFNFWAYKFDSSNLNQFVEKVS